MKHKVLCKSKKKKGKKRVLHVKGKGLDDFKSHLKHYQVANPFN